MSGPMVSMVTMVTRYTGGLSQLPVVEMSWGKNSKKKPSVQNIFLFSGQFYQTHWSHDHHGPPGTQVGYVSFQWSK